MPSSWVWPQPIAPGRKSLLARWMASASWWVMKLYMTGSAALFVIPDSVGLLLLGRIEL